MNSVSQEWGRGEAQAKLKKKKNEKIQMQFVDTLRTVKTFHS